MNGCDSNDIIAEQVPRECVEGYSVENGNLIETLT